MRFVIVLSCVRLFVVLMYMCFVNSVKLCEVFGGVEVCVFC